MKLEYQDGDVTVYSSDPLRGTLELVGDDDDVHTLMLDEEHAAWLISALAQFLAQGDELGTSERFGTA